MGDHQIIENAALSVGEQRIALATFGQVDDIDRYQLFQRGPGWRSWASPLAGGWAAVRRESGRDDATNCVCFQ